MTMRIVFLEPWDGYQPGEDAFIERPKARLLCEEDKAVPYMTWADAEKKRKEENAQMQAEKPKPVKKPAPPKRRYKKREKAVTVDDSATTE